MPRRFNDKLLLIIVVLVLAMTKCHIDIEFNSLEGFDPRVYLEKLIMSVKLRFKGVPLDASERADYWKNKCVELMLEVTSTQIALSKSNADLVALRRSLFPTPSTFNQSDVSRSEFMVSDSTISSRDHLKSILTPPVGGGL